MLSGYADENVDLAIVEQLRRRGMDVVTAQERNQRNTDDELLLETAAAESRLMLTNDTDFLRLHSEWMHAGRMHSGIVYWHVNQPIGSVIVRLAKYAAETVPADAVNAEVFL